MEDKLPLAVALGERLRVARERTEMTQEQASLKLGFTSHSAVGQWERGVTLPSLLNLIQVAELYPASLDWLVWEMGHNIDNRVKALPAILREPLISRIENEIADAEKLAKRLPSGFSAPPVANERVQRWFGTTTKPRKTSEK